jgi:hypothetical protein
MGERRLTRRGGEIEMQSTDDERFWWIQTTFHAWLDFAEESPTEFESKAEEIDFEVNKTAATLLRSFEWNVHRLRFLQ